MALFPPYHGPPLLDTVTSTENIVLAWQRVERNIQLRRRGRSAGIDAVTVQDFKADLARQLDTLVDELRSGRYRPLPSVRVAIPKRDGGARAIAILAVRDRVVQRAVQQVLEPLFDPYFLDCSFGCRPRVGVVDALRRVERYAEQGLTWVVDADIANYFDAIDQRLLLGLIRQRVPDVPLLRLIAQLLEAGASTTAEDDPLAPSDRGGLGLLRRGGDFVRHTFSSGRPHMPPSLDVPNLTDYAADSWEDPRGLGGWPGVPLQPFDRPPPSQHSLLNTLWSVYLLGRPLSGVARQVWPQVQRIGGPRLLAAGTAAAGAVALAEVVLRWQQTAQRGTPQGGALSPLLANIYLHPFDVALTSQGARLVRFMDDFVVLCASEAEAQRTLTLVERQLAPFRLQLQPAKTRIVHYADGLEFLGQALVPKRRGPRWIDGVRTFDEAQERLRAGAQQVRRTLKRR